MMSYNMVYITCVLIVVLFALSVCIMYTIQNHNENIYTSPPPETPESLSIESSSDSPSPIENISTGSRSSFFMSFDLSSRPQDLLYNNYAAPTEVTLFMTSPSSAHTSHTYLPTNCKVVSCIFFTTGEIPCSIELWHWRRASNTKIIEFTNIENGNVLRRKQILNIDSDVTFNVMTDVFAPQITLTVPIFSPDGANAHKPFLFVEFQPVEI